MSRASRALLVPRASHMFLVVMVLAALVTTVVSGVGIASAAVPLVNPGFETGNFSGWTIVGGDVAVVTSHGSYAPQEGSYSARIQSAGCTPGEISQTVSVSAGDTVSGWAFFQAGDYMPYNDNARGSISRRTAPFFGTPT